MTPAGLERAGARVVALAPPHGRAIALFHGGAVNAGSAACLSDADRVRGRALARDGGAGGGGTVALPALALLASVRRGTRSGGRAPARRRPRRSVWPRILATRGPGGADSRSLQRLIHRPRWRREGKR